MRIGGLQKFTLIDYPGKIAAIIFTQGCNFHCGYCHNPQLACPKDFLRPIKEKEVLDFLESRRGKLQGVVITGGEPTIQRGLLDFLFKLRAMGYAIKLDTNGSHPEVLASVLELNLVDLIAMDIKTSLSKYEMAIGVKPDTARIQESIDLILNSGVRHQFRTTLVRAHCTQEDLRSIQGLIGPSRHYILQSFVPLSTIIDPQILAQKQYTQNEVREFRLEFQRGI